MADSHGKGGTIRIIAGHWKRYRLRVPDVPGLRPTPDRVRETLFNWLGDRICGMRCLDLFAGSGALGFEAASRGAAEIVFVEWHKDAVKDLEAGAHALINRDARPRPGMLSKIIPGGTPKITILHSDALRYLMKSSAGPFDMVFLDPPFDSDLLETACRLLDNGRWLGETTGIYLEMRRFSPQPALPAGWAVTHSAMAGEIRYALAHGVMIA
uniref:Ribosomal RNA small subunit methyltransferase D n=1 Tax=Candidatus Kentrum eta TaxID=2126337 RepID=A0A450VAT8_9GAMM|nr:MAG: 16S rRNA (guanine966-N2)-methyltransferase [Candidatus Kentron sp. H]VFK03351.1 MAG: 16S rRNA (guanine966-N2)-methyltransferase [Candidatus Kentron sp. H]VFK05957.1 MAG: 16S rRNA (guanine966-N2)-methyltransferase [Candidatus Kentron sp. H]